MMAAGCHSPVADAGFLPGADGRPESGMPGYRITKAHIVCYLASCGAYHQWQMGGVAPWVPVRFRMFRFTWFRTLHPDIPGAEGILEKRVSFLLVKSVNLVYYSHILFKREKL